MVNLEYPNLLDNFKEHIDPQRTESASFLIWYLENYYRLDPLDAVDCVCDQSGDKGVDGIYINHANATIDIFQSKIQQKPGKTIGDTLLKEFSGSLTQFKNRESIQNLIDTGGSAQVVQLIKRLNLQASIEQYSVRGIFICNSDLDANGSAYLAITSSIEFVGKSQLEHTYIARTREVPQNLKATFDISGLNVSKHYVDAQTLAFIAPIKAVELVKMPGLSDQSAFAYNVRGPLGNTNVNRDIVKSIGDKSLHKKFPLFHNGITVVTNKINETSEKITIETFFVVNGCQSLTALFKNQHSLTEDLRILTKFVQVSVDSDLAKIITRYSNNQNGVKPRDFKSNNPIQVRLQNEIKDIYHDEFFFEIKRGEQSAANTINNEHAGVLLMSFDLKEPWVTHRRYQVFDEKYNAIYARPEVSADRIVLLHLLDGIVIEALPKLKNQLVAKYILARFSILYMLRQIFENDRVGQDLLKDPGSFIRDEKSRQKFLNATRTILNDIIIDFNGEVENLGQDFDYRSKLRDEQWIKKLSQEIVGSYLKQVSRGRIESFEKEWNK